MAGNIFIGTDNIAKSPKNILIGNSNEAKQVSSIFVGNPLHQAIKVWPDDSGGGGGGGGGSDIPDKYQRVEYLVSTGTTNVFNIGITPNTSTRIIIDFEFTSIDFEYLIQRGRAIASPFFAKYPNSYRPTNSDFQTGYGLFIGATKEDNGIYYYFRCCFGGNEFFGSYDIESFYSSHSYYSQEEVKEYFSNYILNKRMTLDLNQNNEWTLYINNSLVYTFRNVTQITNVQTLYLLTSDPVLLPSSSDSYAPPVKETLNHIKLYSCQIYRNGEPVSILLPCYDKSKAGNHGGLYDTVRSRFYKCTYESYFPITYGPNI